MHEVLQLRTTGETTAMKPEETLGQLIQRLRVECELTQAQLAELAGVNVSSLRGWETDRREPGLRMIYKLAKVFGVTIEYMANTIPKKEAKPITRRAGPTRLQLSGKELIGITNRNKPPAGWLDNL